MICMLGAVQNSGRPLIEILYINKIDELWIGLRRSILRVYHQLSWTISTGSHCKRLFPAQKCKKKQHLSYVIHSNPSTDLKYILFCIWHRRNPEWGSEWHWTTLIVFSFAYSFAGITEYASWCHKQLKTISDHDILSSVHLFMEYFAAQKLTEGNSFKHIDVCQWPPSSY